MNCKEEVIIGVIIVVLSLIIYLFYLLCKKCDSDIFNEEYKDLIQCSGLFIILAIVWVLSCSGYI